LRAGGFSTFAGKQMVMKNKVLTACFFVGCSMAFAGPASQKHVVHKGETLYSICREYDVRLNELLKANPTVAKSKTIRPGEQIVIPSVKNAVVASATPSHAAKTNLVKPAPVPSTPGVQYRDEDVPVKPRAVQPEASNAALSEKQPITEITPANAPASFSAKAGPVNISDYAGLFSQYATHGLNVVKNQGEANYLAENTSGNPYLALYNDAEVGSVVQVVNMMNKKTIYVKVIGRLSSIDMSHEVILKLSHQAAAEMGATDDKFLVEVAGVKQ
jgi:LysM domain